MKNLQAYAFYLYPEMSSKWEICSFELLPRGSQNYTHVEVRGGITRRETRGANKGDRVWDKGIDSFIFDLDSVTKFTYEVFNGGNPVTQNPAATED